MNTAQLNHLLRKIHLWVGIAIGLQIGLWLISGLFMTLFPIDQVRGTHLRTQDKRAVLSHNDALVHPNIIISAQTTAPNSLLLKTINGAPVYILKIGDETRVINARSGEPYPEISESIAKTIAQNHYSGQGRIISATYFAQKTPQEYRRSGPVWRVNFDKPDRASFYIDARSGDVNAVRTGLWRTFDFMWGLHIMDWKGRENFNSWWIKSVASMAVLFFLTGFGLVIIRLRAMMTRRQRLKKSL